MKLIDLLNLMSNNELVKVKVYVSGATFERIGSVAYWKTWDKQFIETELKNVSTDTKDECITVALYGDLL